MLTRILIVDDHMIVREGLKQLLQDENGFEMMGEAADGRSALEEIRAKPFEVVLLDMSMPGISGVDLIKQIRNEKPKLPILVLSMHQETQYAVRALKAGANGYITKDNASKKLIEAINKVVAGGMYVSPEVGERLAFDLSDNRVGHQNELPHELLSNRELQIFTLIVSGMPIVTIARDLFLSAKTVSTHKTRIQQKMGMSSTVELLTYAIEHDLRG